VRQGERERERQGERKTDRERERERGRESSELTCDNVNVCDWAKRSLEKSI
jgi:hypothetical protein